MATVSKPISNDQVAWTEPNGAFPGYVNIAEIEGGVRITVRHTGGRVQSGAVASLDIPRSIFHRLMKDAKDKFSG